MHSLCPGDREDKVELEEERRSIDVARLHKKIYKKFKNIKNISLMYFFNLRESNVLQRERKYLFALSRSWATLWIFLWTGLVLVLTMVPYWKKQNINNRLLSFMRALSFPITKRYRQQHHYNKKQSPITCQGDFALQQQNQNMKGIQQQQQIYATKQSSIICKEHSCGVLFLPYLINNNNSVK